MGARPCKIIPAPDDEVAERFQPAADIRCFKRPAVIPHELSGEPVNVALPHGTDLRRGLPELPLPVLDAAFQTLILLPQRIQRRKVLGEPDIRVSGAVFVGDVLDLATVTSIYLVISIDCSSSSLGVAFWCSTI